MPNMDLLKTLITNNTFNLDTVEKTLNNVKQNSFNFLYGLQLDLVGYKRYDFKISDLKLTEKIGIKSSVYPRKYCFIINDAFVVTQKRRAWKNSKFFKKSFSIFDTTSNPDIFKYTYMVFIDGKFYDTIDMFCHEEKSYIIFDIAEGKNTTGIPLSLYNSLKDKDANITVIFLPNCAYGAYTTNRNVLQKYSNNLALKRFNIVNNLSTDTQFVTFVNTTDELFGSVITMTTNSTEMLKFYSGNSSTTFDNKTVYLNVFGFRNLYDRIDLAGTEKYFQIPVMEMPIPVENIMIFRVINGKKYFAHDISINLYYPNIYEVIGNINNDALSMYVFYSDDTPGVIELQYKDRLKDYYNFANDTLQQFKDNTISDIIKNYKPLHYVYSIKDYQSSDTNDDLSYKIDKLKSWINQDNEVLRAYLYNQYKTNPSSDFYLDMSKIDLSKKYRTNNFIEIIDPSKQEVFDEGRYLFILRNDFKPDFYHLRFFIDGKLYIPDKAYKDSNYEYYYIPTTLFKTNSIMEIEKFNDFSFDYNFNVIDDSDMKIVTFNSPNMLVQASDINLMYTDNTIYLDRTNFKIYIDAPDGTIIEIPNTNNKELPGKFYVTITNPNLFGQNLTIYTRKISHLCIMNIDSISKTGDTLNVQGIPSSNNPKYFRIFRNGYLLPPNLYNIDFRDQMSDTFTVGVNMIKLVGDVYTVDGTPNKYDMINFQKDIPSDGFIDLQGIINKPFDLKWYDTYVNGQKLTKNNIDIVSPTKIFIKNVNSLKNFMILQKDRDDEYFSLDTVSSFNDNLFNGISSYKNYLYSNHGITDIVDDLITQTIDEISQDLVSFFDLTMKPLMIINPDQQQLTDNDIATYPAIYVINNDILLNPDDGFYAQDNMDINPDVPIQ